MSSSTPIFISNSSEERWTKHIIHNYTEDHDIHNCVFKVPENIRDTKPQAYTPQAVGLGPFHHFRPEVQKMEGQKRVAVKNHITREEFKYFIKLMTEPPEEFESTVRSYYDRFLDLDGKTLSRIMVLDGIFLLHVIKDCLDQKEEYTGLVPDILMLENQIPLEVLKQIQTALKRSFTEATDIDLFNKFTRFCNEQSPLKLSGDPEFRDGVFKKHLLHYMYQLIVGNNDHQISYASASEPSKTFCQESVEELVEEEPENSDEKSPEEPENPNEKTPERCSAKICTLAEQTVNKVKNFVMRVAELTRFQPKEAVKQAGDLANSAYERLASSGVKVPDDIQKTVKFLQRLKNASYFYDQGDNQVKFFAHEIDVPTVSQLYQIAEIKFACTNGGIKTVRFDEKSNTLYLPVITLRRNSEVILRNLVAYEAASAKPGSIRVLSEYLDLMCGIIDTEKDVILLKDMEIIKAENLSAKEIVSIFNGIDKSTERPNEKSEVQVIVKTVNEQFNNLGMVKAYQSIKKFLGRLQDLIKRLFPLLVLILLTLQYACDIRGCSSRGLGYAAVRWDSSFGDGSSLSLDSHANYLMIPRKMLRYSN